MKYKKVFYSRVSSENGQKDDRQVYGLEGFDLVLSEKCSGVIPLYERPKGKELKKLIDSGELEHLEIHSMCRLGRDLLSVLKVWNDLTEKGVKVVCRNPNIRNLDDEGKVDPFSKLLMSIVSTMSEFERKLIKERQQEGIRIRKLKGLYTGRKIGTTDTPERFLCKPKNQEIVKYLKEGRLSYKEISKIVGCSETTIVKVKKQLEQISQEV